jgi:O-antigen ligase
VSIRVQPRFRRLNAAKLLAALGLAALAVVTLASPGATRMYATPWFLAHAVALLAPALLLLRRALDRARPLVLPPAPWLAVVALLVVAVLASALASPHRGPSLLWSAPLLAAAATFFVGYDWLAGDPARRPLLHRSILVASAAVAVASLGLWLDLVRQLPSADFFNARNPYPLGHSNYTAGLAVLVLPTAVAAARTAAGRWRALGFAVTAAALALLFTSGSRGGFIGLAALLALALWVAPWPRRRKLQLAAAAVLAVALFAAAHPRTRTLFSPAADRTLAASDVQRSAMLEAGRLMTLDRPLLGWGPGTVPLVYPLYRARLDGGAETVLQLHSAPVHVAAELGLPAAAALLALVVLVLRHRARDPAAAVALLGYAAFSLTDWQLDVPVFAAALALLAAALAPPRPAAAPAPAWARPALAAAVIAALASLALFGRPDPTPALNVRALALARDAATADPAAALFRESLALNPAQELAHFNLAWLLVTRDPAAAERHFAAAARLVPDKGGVWFGLGLARLNQNRRDAALHAFAVECLNDPAFLFSPWWRDPALAPLRPAAARLCADFLGKLPPSATPAGAAARLAAVLAALPPLPEGPERVYHRERTGYPVLTRQPDLPAPRDLYVVREPAPAVAATLPPLPPKSWLPSPHLLTFLD